MRSILASLDFESVAALVVLWLLALGVVAGPADAEYPDADVNVVAPDAEPAAELDVR